MSDQADTQKSKVFTGRHMLIIMLCFFGVIILVNLTMAVLASKSWTGLIVKNGYVASQHFNKNQEAQEQFLAAGWQSQLNYKNGHFTLTLSKQEEALKDCIVTGLLNRPVHENSNQRLQFKHLYQGVYEANNLLDTGRWNLEVQALCNKKDTSLPFIQHYKFIVPDSDNVQ